MLFSLCSSSCLPHHDLSYFISFHFIFILHITPSPSLPDAPFSMMMTMTTYLLTLPIDLTNQIQQSRQTPPSHRLQPTHADAAASGHQHPRRRARTHPSPHHHQQPRPRRRPPVLLLHRPSQHLRPLAGARAPPHRREWAGGFPEDISEGEEEGLVVSIELS